eukprot:gnl/TRDRNA2_/TRDRNA2_173113_c1_seq2.p1 gnl/TRDRNA2_/TRDRNA2_173113_c1~~gnl/TRDRNA2_/TRDRNA2_173113_c1_seq2.p1  ORF type:complete len:1373 (+),score=267.94 gnl/TRDRNA2_/TRDRNA2_173113_c1_seq2:20-4138(+)
MFTCRGRSVTLFVAAAWCASVAGQWQDQQQQQWAWPSSAAGASATIRDADPSAQQLLELASELTRLHRFADAKATLAAAAVRSAPLAEVLAQVDVLRWRMGLRQLSPAEADQWLDWRSSHVGVGMTGGAGAGGETPSQEQETDWQEVHAAASESLSGAAAGSFPSNEEQQPKPAVRTWMSWSVVLAASILCVLAAFIASGRCLRSGEPCSEEHSATEESQYPPPMLATTSLSIEEEHSAPPSPDAAVSLAAAGALRNRPKRSGAVSPSGCNLGASRPPVVAFSPAAVAVAAEVAAAVPTVSVGEFQAPTQHRAADARVFASKSASPALPAEPSSGSSLSSQSSCSTPPPVVLSAPAPITRSKGMYYESEAASGGAAPPVPSAAGADCGAGWGISGGGTAAAESSAAHDDDRHALRVAWTERGGIWTSRSQRQDVAVGGAAAAADCAAGEEEDDDRGCEHADGSDREESLAGRGAQASHSAATGADDDKDEADASETGIEKESEEDGPSPRSRLLTEEDEGSGSDGIECYGRMEELEQALMDQGLGAAAQRAANSKTGEAAMPIPLTSPKAAATPPAVLRPSRKELQAGAPPRLGCSSDDGLNVRGDKSIVSPVSSENSQVSWPRKADAPLFLRTQKSRVDGRTVTHYKLSSHKPQSCSSDGNPESGAVTPTDSAGGAVSPFLLEAEAGAAAAPESPSRHGHGRGTGAGTPGVGERHTLLLSRFLAPSADAGAGLAVVRPEHEQSPVAAAGGGSRPQGNRKPTTSPAEVPWTSAQSAILAATVEKTLVATGAAEPYSALELEDRTVCAATAISAIVEEEEWGWGQDVEITKKTPEQLKADDEEAQKAAAAMAAAWTPKPQVWFAGPQGPRPALCESDLLAQHQPAGSHATGPERKSHVQAADKGGGGAIRARSLPPTPTAAAQSPAKGAATRMPERQNSSEDRSGDDAHDMPTANVPNVGSNRSRVTAMGISSGGGSTGRTWHAGSRTRAVETVQSGGPASPKQMPVDAKEEGFMHARATRFRPMGCFVRVEGGAELFLPVEHIEPRTEATTAAIRERMKELSTKNSLVVRKVPGVQHDAQATMLSRAAYSARASELVERRRGIEAGAAWLRDNYDPRAWVSGRVSALQPTGAYVSVVEGRDAFVPLAEISAQYTEPVGEEGGSGASGDGTSALRPKLQIGQTIQFRVIRHSWQSDSFTASMLSYDESVKRHRAAQNVQTSSVTSSRSPASATTRARSAEPVLSGTGAAESTLAETPAPAKIPKHLAAKGFSIVDTARANELNEFLKAKTAESGKKASAGGQARERKYIINLVRGMNSKVIGNLTFATKCSEKEIKEAAIALAIKEGKGAMLVKSEADIKGVSFAKNMIHVKC